MSAREDLAAAASTVDDVTVDAWPRQHTQDGRGYVAFTRAEQDGSGLGFMDWWAIVITLPGTPAAAERWIESHRDQLVAALRPELVVTLLQPIELLLDQGSVNALSIEGARPH